MCGIVGYVGSQSALEVVLAGLKRLEYRGYDSAGAAVLADGAIAVAKKSGKLVNLEKALVDRPLPAGATGIGHTRWATHGGPTDANAHPHLDGARRVAVVHNGIIENFADLRHELAARGHVLRSETDTEVVAHLLAEEFSGCADLAEAMRLVCRRLQGAFTLVAVHADVPDLVVGARRNSPLVVGVGEDEAFLASDVSAFIAHTRSAVELGQDQVVQVRRDEVVVTDFYGRPADVRHYRVDWDAAAAEKGGYATFMHKEIAEQPRAVAATLRGWTGGDDAPRFDSPGLDAPRFDSPGLDSPGIDSSGLDSPRSGSLRFDSPCSGSLGISDQALRDFDKVVFVACGTAFHAGLVAKHAVEQWARVPCEVELASEFRYRGPLLDARTLVVAVSQSGETMDTLMALRHAREQGSSVLAICNTNGSTLPREADAVLYTHAGPEVAVASTKAFLTQLVACYLVALHLARVRGAGARAEVAEAARDLAAMPGAVERVLAGMEPVRELARSLAGAGTGTVLFLGRHVGYPVALEGALKLKELAYMHAEGFAAGELKHGPIALVEEGLPVVVVVPSPRAQPVLHDKIVSNIQEIRARGARTVVIAEEGDEAVVPYADHVVRVPVVAPLLAPLVATVPLQVFACELALARGHEVDQPRNLAKSVTVE
ncbi:glutamine--fructose-6-phosphate transaminase (isomerizing) [Streptomyces sp. p1417]|uniref:Glutamine--fructose-6-phosphate aminotransferase [isomerizing] n=1 Tax=Streptomyces typhae TaxID=2681492 RepID=A0A6L6WPZ4_9ACTN|nr:glutamine--fructose-6-phosphate transaminase (isomerizing) [Streptomyces typhae]MVO83689.1 glutamine--fructose-6-phosphate transaminase (isomerizing) [Streptomyces typhae]